MPVASSATTAGQLLRQARLKANVHLAVLSVTLKVPVRQLEALEADELDMSKGPAFYRGLASSVCRHLHLEPAPVLALLPQASTRLKAVNPHFQSMAKDQSLRIGRSSKVMWSALLMLLLTGALIWLPGPAQWIWLDDVKSLLSDDVVSQEVQETVPASVPLESSVPLLNDNAAMRVDVLPAGSVDTNLVTSPPSSAPAASASPVASQATTPSRVGEPNEWVFTATGDSWLEMRNPQKAVVWSGVVKAGESTRIQSPLPVSVVVGRAQLVSATFRGQPFDLKPHTQVTVARFEVKE
jgi:cytoskeleton protein RodZ